MTKRQRERRRQDQNAAYLLFQQHFPHVPIAQKSKANEDLFRTCVAMIVQAREQLRDDIMGTSPYQLQDE
jgi:hypothetical protein